MAPKKVNLQWIANKSSRRATYKRRCRGLMRKASELTTLSRAKVCVVVYGEGEAQPEVWPSVEDAMHLLKKFKDTPELSSFKKTKNQETFLKERASTLRGQVCRSDRANCARETSHLLHDSMDGRRLGLVGASAKELSSLSLMVQERMNKAKERLQKLVFGQGALPEPPPSSQMMQASYTCTEMQTFSPAMEVPQPLQQDWLADLAPNGGDELGAAVFCGAVAGSSTGPSGSGCGMMQPYNNLGSCSGLPWTWE